MPIIEVTKISVGFQLEQVRSNQNRLWLPWCPAQNNTALSCQFGEEHAEKCREKYTWVQPKAF